VVAGKLYALGCLDLVATRRVTMRRSSVAAVLILATAGAAFAQEYLEYKSRPPGPSAGSNAAEPAR